MVIFPRLRNYQSRLLSCSTLHAFFPKNDAIFPFPALVLELLFPEEVLLALATGVFFAFVGFAAGSASSVSEVGFFGLALRLVCGSGSGSSSSTDSYSE